MEPVSTPMKRRSRLVLRVKSRAELCADIEIAGSAGVPAA